MLFYKLAEHFEEYVHFVKYLLLDYCIVELCILSTEQKNEGTALTDLCCLHVFLEQCVLQLVFCEDFLFHFLRFSNVLLLNQLIRRLCGCCLKE